MEVLAALAPAVIVLGGLVLFVALGERTDQPSAQPGRVVGGDHGASSWRAALIAQERFPEAAPGSILRRHPCGAEVVYMREPPYTLNPDGSPHHETCPIPARWLHLTFTRKWRIAVAAYEKRTHGRPRSPESPAARRSRRWVSPRRRAFGRSVAAFRS